MCLMYDLCIWKRILQDSKKITDSMIVIIVSKFVFWFESVTGGVWVKGKGWGSL